MKNKLFFLLFILVTNFLQAQTSEQYSIKLEGIYGNIIPHDQHVKDLILNPVTGAELSLEFQTMGEKPWQQFNGFPVIGIGAVYLDLGNAQKLGNAFALYPYISYPLISTRSFKLSLKAGAGASYLTKTYYNTNKDSLGGILPLSQTNGAIGSNLNVYFSGGGSLEIPIAKGFSLIGEYTWNHMSNGSAVAPNSGLNVLNGFAGLKYTPNYTRNNIPNRKNLPDMIRSLSFEIIVSGGFRQLYYKDNKTFPIGSVVMGVYRPISNFYRMGLALDAFYDGVYNGRTQFERTYITNDELKNKIRVGVSWQNEIILGRLTAGVDLGLYLYDPLKNLSPVNTTTGELINPSQNKPLIYPYNIDVNGVQSGEDGWFYTRATLKYALNNQLFISLGLKTHLQKAEFIEWGLGYRF